MNSRTAPLLRLGQPACPEREDPTRPGWLEEQGEKLLGLMARSWRSARACRVDIVRRVRNEQASLQGLGAEALLERAQQVGRQLRRDGLQTTTVARALALAAHAAAGQLGLQPHDVQLQGAWIMLNGLVAEMQTGEGKTLTAGLAACVAALAGAPVHVITVNDYLVARDAQELQPLYAALGLRVGAALEKQSPDERRAAYACHVAYVSSKTLVFDYLRDRIALAGRGSGLRLQLARLAGKAALQPSPGGAHAGGLLLRGLHFAIVDEADSVLVDEARTPLIISAPQQGGDEERVMQQALALARELQSGPHYRLHKAERRVELTPAGLVHVRTLTQALGGAWAGQLRRDELATQALSALLLFDRDVHYLVREGKVQIVDEHTGRVMADRSWERGLHQLIEAKEGCEITAPKSPLARISYQRFFRRYLRLAGMTGTAREVGTELGAVYGLAVVRVSTHRPDQRRVMPWAVLPTEDRKWQHVATRVAQEHARGRPVLLGTRSVAASEAASAQLHGLGLPHRLLNAKQDLEEANIVAEAGQAGRITIATSMAGRGTDIKITPEVAALGGLHVLLSELHDASRVDRQLAGRCARQGDPGSFETIVCLEDTLMTGLNPAWRTLWRTLLKHLTRLWPGAAARLGGACLRLAQRQVERRHAHIRKGLLKTDHDAVRLLAFSGRPE